MKKEQFLQICEDAWGRYENMTPKGKQEMDAVFALGSILGRAASNDAESYIEGLNRQLAVVNGTIFALAAFRPQVDFVGGKYRVRSKSAPE